MGAFCLFNHKIQDLLAAIYTIFDGHIAGLLNVAWINPLSTIPFSSTKTLAIMV